MNSDLWPGTHSVPCCGGWEGRFWGDLSEAPLSNHSQCFIYGPLHFWLWWLQYLISYLNCIFKDFIQYLHAIRYEFFFFSFANFFCLFFSYLIVFILACLSLLFTSRCAPWIYFRWKMSWGMFPGCFYFYFLFFCVCVCVLILMTTEHQEAGKTFAGCSKLWCHLLLLAGITGPQRGQEESTFWFRELDLVN